MAISKDGNRLAVSNNSGKLDLLNSSDNSVIACENITGGK